MFGIPSGPPENYVTLSLRSLGYAPPAYQENYDLQITKV